MHGAAACVLGAPTRLFQRRAITLEGGVALQAGRPTVQLIISSYPGSSSALCLLSGLLAVRCIVLYIIV